MVEIQVHPVGTKVVIDHENNTIWTQMPGEQKPREVYQLSEEWLKPFTICRKCGKLQNDQNLARAYWALQSQVCSTECLRAETLQRYACCDKAQQYGCVCSYATTCPDHGLRHHGTHD